MIKKLVLLLLMELLNKILWNFINSKNICSFKGNLNDIYNLMDYYKESYKENFSNLDEKKYKLDNCSKKKQTN